MIVPQSERQPDERPSRLRKARDEGTVLSHPIQEQEEPAMLVTYPFRTSRHVLSFQVLDRFVFATHSTRQQIMHCS